MTDRLNSKSESLKKTPHEWAERGNQVCAEIGRSDIDWIVRDGRVMCVWKKSAAVMLAEDKRRKPVMDRRGEPMSESDTFALNKELERLGATVCYASDGTRYDAETGEPIARRAA